jgi:hypothetical protein
MRVKNQINPGSANLFDKLMRKRAPRENRIGLAIKAKLKLSTASLDLLKEFTVSTE